MGSTLRLVVAYGVMSCFLLGVGQSGSTNSALQAALDEALYASFFRQVAQLRNVSGSGLLNGQAATLTQPTVKDAIGLTEAESQALHAIASDCEFRVRLFDDASQPSVFDARVRILAAEDTASSASQAVQQLNDVAKKHDQIVLDHVERLRAALGNSRFTMLDLWVHSRKQAESFFPSVHPQN